MDPAAVTAIDVHVHVHASVDGSAVDEESMKQMAEYFRTDDVRPGNTRDIAAYYRERAMAAVVFGVDSVHRDGGVTNEEVAELAAENADVLIPFASIDPARGAEGVAMARRLITDYGVKGFKFHPNTQAFYPNDRSVYPLYEVIAEHGRIALFHSGHTGVGAGTPGGGGVRLKYSNPMYVDDVAVDFPSMPIILAHPSFPWQDEALSVALHKPTVHIDLSGWSPKYFPPQLVQYANTLLRHKMLFGSDYPVITPERWLRDFDKLDIRPEVRPLILKDNAAALFGLGKGDS
ncbi:4-hydroxyphenyl-beta-ketoacyl-CoA hydrolase [Prauserella muralis]|uniref:4-hydroxyphenyl-beta-ketoacyl-CoA hydrolase n=1 Tax=Prauserella muralis TaxID=588067 RepID=A0A2V4BF16_9PSEU|nr:4-hydroxyphenyl-beta-ketoacyl-CoA hydrolase [Prauserella muralis]